MIAEFCPAIIDFLESEELIGSGFEKLNLVSLVDSDPAILGVEAFLKAVLCAFLEFSRHMG